ncbi:glycosyltransferase family 2 protein [Oleidesulfovibrio sp.]|uniref:glycosyltransferase family 2 protein n=1 Tax=Oleidesulfovibrio sp. TaxID=2909707 RepID=UPI003A855D69
MSSANSAQQAVPAPEQKEQTEQEAQPAAVNAAGAPIGDEKEKHPADRKDGQSTMQPEKDKSGDAPSVSIIMNCLNCSRHLPQTLQSLLAQTYTDWEVIFWDNASTDGSHELVEACNDARMRIFRAAQTVPLGMARNLAMCEAQGRYIAFLDCDDIWLPEKLAKQVALLDADAEVGLVCTDTMQFTDTGEELNRIFALTPPHCGRVFSQLLRGYWISMSSAMIRRSALDHVAGVETAGDGTPLYFDPLFSICEEADLFLRIAWAHKLDHVPEALTRWRVHSGSTTFDKFELAADETRMMCNKFTRLLPHFATRCHAEAELLQAQAAFREAVGHWKAGNGAASRAALRGRINTIKAVAMFSLSFLPSSLYRQAAAAYMRFARFFR